MSFRLALRLVPVLAVAAIVGFALAGDAGLGAKAWAQFSLRRDNGLVTKPSNKPVKETIDALAAAVEAAGIKVIARVDHAAGAKAVGQTLAPTEVLLFGAPLVGTPLMQSDPRIGLELPMKVLAWQDAAGKVWIAYTRPDALAKRFGIKGRVDVLEAMKQALDKLTTEAAK